MQRNSPGAARDGGTRRRARSVTSTLLNYLLGFRPLLSKAINRLLRIYNNKLKFPLWVFPTLPMTHHASCLTLTGRPWVNDNDNAYAFIINLWPRQPNSQKKERKPNNHNHTILHKLNTMQYTHTNIYIQYIPNIGWMSIGWAKKVGVLLWSQ